MDGFAEKYAVETDGRAFEKNMITDGCLRITVITPELIRIEHCENGTFCDSASQTVLFRNLGAVEYTESSNGNSVTVKTSKCEFEIQKSGRLKSVTLFDGRTVTDFKKGNLKGTRRTLDVTFGKVKLGDGIISRDGVAVMDDSDTLVFSGGGTLVPRKCKGGTDQYVFAYGFDYRNALRNFYRITGKTPLIPRFCLGNWWSRFWAYTQDEYLGLMKKFEDKDIPLTVACVDMDWHWTDVKKRFGDKVRDYPKPKNPVANITGSFWNPGWTGYSWNTELFPDHKGFLDELHRRGLSVNLNVHPAQGIRFFEDMYSDFADYMGVDKENKESINFDFTDKKFIEGYFKYINEPMEKEGVDFWWIDWQQGSTSAVEGLDPLWLLNHYYCLDRQRHGLRPLTLSRFAGFGSHRYPLGFSGDTAIRWSVLDFQPYFTATAANAGYTWWSHDIGGHNFGKVSDELYLRWVQFGVFSPIMRFHSANNARKSKEPWKFGEETESIARKFLRLRHRMIPYTYTMNRLTETEGRPLLMPIYYEYPEHPEAYTVGNEYFFGTQLIAAPITKKADKNTNTAAVYVWLPEGRYTDIFTGQSYEGGRRHMIRRDVSLIPVLAKAGAIIPLDGRKNGNSFDNPDTFDILIYRGNGDFTLYEDDGRTLDYRDGKYANTHFSLCEKGNNLIFTVEPAAGDLSVIPDVRDWQFEFRNVADAEKVIVDGADFMLDKKNGYVTVTVKKLPTSRGVSVRLSAIKNK